jgi:hypothetical protein
MRGMTVDLGDPALREKARSKRVARFAFCRRSIQGDATRTIATIARHLNKGRKTILKGACRLDQKAGVIATHPADEHADRPG